MSINTSKGGAVAAPPSTEISENKVLKNTFMLLGATLGFSAILATVAILMAVQPFNPWIVLLVYFGLLWAVHSQQNTGLALPLCFATTGWLGFTLGPIVGLYMTFVGPEIVLYALGMTAVMFFGLSGYAMTSKKDFSYMGGFLMVGILTAFIGGIVAYIFAIPALMLAVAAAFVILSSGLILWQISEIIHGGETNYVMATITLYVAIYNLFTSLLALFGFFGDD